jgi:hypothetical protein
LTIVVQCLGLASALYACTDSFRVHAPGHGSSAQTVATGSKGTQQGRVAGSNPIHVLISHPSFYAFGATSTYVLYSHENWLGYLGGLGLAFFLMCITPIVFGQVAAAKARAGRMIGTAFVVYCLLNLASIFTVAYAFVPGGVYFRERTNLYVSVFISDLR